MTAPGRSASPRQAAVGAYLDELDRALAALPQSRRREIVNDIAEHIDNAVDVDVSETLRRLGDPLAIAAAALEDEPGAAATPQVDAQRGNGLEIAAIILLAAGGFLWLVGWLVGVGLLWASSRWSRRDKLLGTLLVPGGLLPAFVLVFSRPCSWAARRTRSAPGPPGRTASRRVARASSTTSSP